MSGERVGFRFKHADAVFKRLMDKTNFRTRKREKIT